MEESREEKHIPTAAYFSIAASVLLILINIFRWHLIEVFSVFLLPFLEGPIILLFLGSMISSVVYFIRNGRKEKLRAIVPLTICIITILIVWFVPFTKINLALDFSKNLEQREKVVSMIQTGELMPNVSHNQSLIALPKEYAHLSKGGGEVVVEREGDNLRVLFFTFRGVLDSFSGFVYISDDTKLQEGNFNTGFLQIEKKKEHWYWGAAK
ncbi:hypothetical protein [Clostridium sp.]|uniref:hypothetical protein n=1 Tax=Clostridium sp. TaxID=1506 RepID=UPI002FCCA5A3